MQQQLLFYCYWELNVDDFLYTNNAQRTIASPKCFLSVAHSGSVTLTPTRGAAERDIE